MPNAFAYLALFAWPLVAVILFKRLALREAVIWTIVAGYLLLPLRTGFNLPVLPTVDKTLIPALAAALLALAANQRARQLWLSFARRGNLDPRRAALTPKPVDFAPKRGQVVFWGLVLLLFAAPLLTAMTNSEPISAGYRFIKGMSLYDALSVNSTLLVSLAPFFLGRRFLASGDAQRSLLKILVIACVGYSVFILYELRMSPQMNNMVYGFFPHNFFQHVRGGGYRPLVFLNHALWLAIIVSMAVLSAFALWKSTDAKDRNRAKWLLAGLWLFGVLFLTKSLGAFLLSVLFIPVLLIFNHRAQVLLAACFAALVLTYPMARSAGIVPVNMMLSVASAIDEYRAESFGFRLRNEDILLEKANRKPLAGWGGWGRSRVYNEMGKDVSTTDGYWVIVMGTYGWLGYVAQFGLLCIPLIGLAWQRKRLEIPPETAGLSIVLCVALIDLIPNATVSPVLWLIAGSMMGRFQTADAAINTAPARSRQRQHETAQPEHKPEPAGPMRPAPVHRRRPRRHQPG